MKKLILVVLVASLLDGCASRGVWKHNSKLSYEVSQDVRECEYQGKVHGFVPYAYGSGNAAAAMSGFEEGLRRAEIQRACMQAKGYYWVSTK